MGSGSRSADALVDERGVRRYGLLPRRPGLVNPLVEFHGPARRLKWLRLKEWMGFTLIHPEVASSFILQDAHYLASSELYVAQLGDGTLTQHAATTRGGSLALPARLFPSRCQLHKPGYLVRYEFGSDGSPHRIHIDVAERAGAAPVIAELELDAADAAPPLSVSARIPGGSMYTHKVLYPAGGTLRVGDNEYEFEPSRDLAILDEHHSRFPYRTTWTWGTLGQMTPDGPLGANLCQRPELPGEADESCLWTPSAVEALTDVAFHTPGNGPWRVTSADGRVELTFTPDGRKEVKRQLGIIAIDYEQLYGIYRGVLRTGHGTHELAGVRGVGERMRTRF